MYYILHHSTGTLMLAAENRRQVHDWSERQLGKHGGLVSIMEADFEGINTLVEKTGTGICFGQRGGCRPMASILADSAQLLTWFKNVDYGPHNDMTDLHGKEMPAWH